MLGELWVWWAATPGYETAERKMLRAFSSGVSEAARQKLHGTVIVAPFANLRAWNYRIKNHGIERATGGATKADPSAESVLRLREPTGKSARRQADPATQTVTATDIAHGRIRLPARSKHLLPDQRADVDVVLDGRVLRARWDPRTGPDRERSGVLSFGRTALADLVEPGSVLGLSLDPGGRLTIAQWPVVRSSS